jgi:hypothetical protein
MTQQLIASTLLRGISGLSSWAIRPTRALPSEREWSRTEHGMTEGFMTLAEDMRPEATLLIGLS